jgi:hypothetical protein
MFIVLEQDSYNVEGDERSRTNPGHGYPAYTVNYTKAHEINSEEELIKWVESNSKYGFRNPYRVFKCEEVEIKQNLSFSVKVKPK